MMLYLENKDSSPGESSLPKATEVLYFSSPICSCQMLQVCLLASVLIGVCLEECLTAFC